MQKSNGELARSPLFAGIDPALLTPMLECLQAQSVSVPAQTLLLAQGDAPLRMGLILRGTVQVVQEDAQGARHVQAELGPGQLFNEVFAFARVPALPVSVISVSACTVLWLDVRRIVSPCSAPCPQHRLLCENMLTILAQRILLLHQKIGYLSQRRTSEKLLAYLRDQSPAPGVCFRIPFNRQQLADYLCVERSALSAELSKLRDAGVLTFHKNAFTLLEQT